MQKCQGVKGFILGHKFKPVEIKKIYFNGRKYSIRQDDIAGYRCKRCGLVWDQIKEGK